MSTEADRLRMTRQRVNARLLQLCKQEVTKAKALHPHYGRLWQAITDQVSNGGKYLRPYIVLLTYEAYGGSLSDTVIDVAAAWELLHIGLLMHDDVIDRDYIRHGQPNVSGQYLITYGPDREHYAQSAGLLAGDLVLAAARRLIAEPKLVAIFDEAYATVIGGELLDMEASISSQPADLQLIAETKTASYSLIGPLLTGATMADVDSQELLQLRALGRVLGIGFQLADDLLVYGDDAHIGKSADSDLVGGKRTMVVAEALQQMSDASRTRAKALLNARDPAHLAELRTLLANTQTLNTLRDRLTDISDEAHVIIDMLNIYHEFRPDFFNLVTMLLRRTA